MQPVLRPNPDLDLFIHDLDLPAAESNGKPKSPAKRKTRQSIARDRVRRYAFKVLATMADLDGPDRARVLKLAEKLNRA